MADITPAELSARLRFDDAVFVLDVQPDDDYEDWHVPGSVHLGIYEALRDDPVAAKDLLAEIPTDTEVVVTCTAGDVSLTAATLLREMGYDAKLLACHRP